jgi:DNA processing protein
MSDLPPSARWSTNSAAPKPPSTRCPCCRGAAAAEAEAEAELEAAESLGAHLVAIGEPGYPPTLAQVDAPPPLIYVKGRLDLADIPIVAIVGARNGSAVGQKFTRQIATDLALEGFVIASGLARGIDTAAHLAALEHGTIAVLAGGIDIVYPPENEDLRAIGEQGLLISERSPGFSPRGKDFPRRNRLISGVSLGVVVVEAAERSGSLITARLAGEQGREVFAVPGSPLDPRSAGTNNLLKQGACLVTSARDIIETLAPILGRPPAPPPVELAAADEHRMPESLPDIRQSEREQIVSALGPSPGYRRIDPRHRACHPQGPYRVAGARSGRQAPASRSAACLAQVTAACPATTGPSVAIRLLALGLFPGDIDKIGEEPHFGAFGDLMQPLEYRCDIFGRLPVRQLT